LPKVGQRAVVVAASLGLMIAIVSAWFAESVWFVGLSNYPTLEITQEHLRGPSLFLITPIAATSTVIIAQVVSFLMPTEDPVRGQQYSWRQIVRLQPHGAGK